MLTVLEGVATEILPRSLLESNSFLIPHWVLIFLILITVFYDREHTYVSIFYGVIFGLLIDVVYTEVLGIYMFSYAFTLYIIHVLKKVFHENFYITTFLGMIGVSLADLTIHSIYYTIGKTNLVWDDYLFYRLIPTVLANLVFLMILYPLLKNKLMRWRKEQ